MSDKELTFSEQFETAMKAHDAKKAVEERVSQQKHQRANEVASQLAQLEIEYHFKKKQIMTELEALSK